VRVVNVVDMTRLLSKEDHPQGQTDFEYDGLFTRDKPVIPVADPPAHLPACGTRKPACTRLPGGGHHGHTVRLVMNDLDRYRLVMDVIDRVPGLAVRAARVRQAMADARTRHHSCIQTHGVDMPEVTEWSWADWLTGPRGLMASRCVV
jgi:xylulose-5-phosphate/fructose-6-phosphate phosphoketolase